MRLKCMMIFVRHFYFDLVIIESWTNPERHALRSRLIVLIISKVANRSFRTFLACPDFLAFHRLMTHLDWDFFDQFRLDSRPMNTGASKWLVEYHLL